MAKSTPPRSAEKDDPIYTGKFTISSHSKPGKTGPKNTKPKSSKALTAQTKLKEGDIRWVCWSSSWTLLERCYLTGKARIHTHPHTSKNQCEGQVFHVGSTIGWECMKDHQKSFINPTFPLGHHSFLKRKLWQWGNWPPSIFLFDKDESV